MWNLRSRTTQRRPRSRGMSPIPLLGMRIGVRWPVQTRMDWRKRPPCLHAAARRYASRPRRHCARPQLHGGGNASVKPARLDLLGKEVEVLCVKGSGWDMAEIEPAGFPALRLNRLRELRARATLADEDMVRLQRESSLDPMAPTASVET